MISFSISYSQVSNEIIDSKVNQSDLKKYINILSSDSLNGRMTGTLGQKKAAKFIAKEFKRLNLATKNNNSYFEKFPLNKTFLNKIYIKSLTKDYLNFRELIYIGNPINNEIEKEIIFAGYGTEKELLQISDFTDKIVVIFTDNLRGFNIALEKKLIDKKAYALILANPKSENQFLSMQRTMKDFFLKKKFYFGEQKKDKESKFLNRFIFKNESLESLFNISIKKLLKASKTSKLNKIPTIKVRLKCERITEKIETENVIGIIKGNTNKSILISAHYDHLGEYGKSYYPGADDNASGISALLEIAEVFSCQNLKYNIIILATSGEEVGLLGSYFHSINENFNSNDIILNLNLDMISRTDDKHKKKDYYIYSIGTDINPIFKNLFTQVDSNYHKSYFDYSLDKSKSLTGVYHLSDQYSFYKKGIPSIMLFSGLHSDYHKITDTADKIDYKLLEYRIELINRVINEIQEKI